MESQAYRDYVKKYIKEAPSSSSSTASVHVMTVVGGKCSRCLFDFPCICEQDVVCTSSGPTSRSCSCTRCIPKSPELLPESMRTPPLSATSPTYCPLSPSPPLSPAYAPLSPAYSPTSPPHVCSQPCCAPTSPVYSATAF